MIRKYGKLLLIMFAMTYIVMWYRFVNIYHIDVEKKTIFNLIAKPPTPSPQTTPTLSPTPSPTLVRNAYDVVMVIPFRNRNEHLNRFLPKMRDFFFNTTVKYLILVVEQSDNGLFNRAWLTNVGLDYMKRNNIKAKCIVQHDVDRYPKQFVNYTDCETPIQLNSENDQWRGGLPYNGYTGGVVSMNTRDWERVNGASNSFFGYGGEDDDLFFRLKINKMLDPKTGFIRRPPRGFGKFSEWHDKFHNKRVRDPRANVLMHKRLNEMQSGSDVWRKDGLNSVKYDLLYEDQMSDVATRITVELPGKHIIYTALGGRDYVSSRKHIEYLAYSVANNLPDASIKIFHDATPVSDDLKHFAHQVVKNIEFVHCHKLKPPYVITRFYCYQDELKGERAVDKIAMVDGTDVVFENNIFDIMHENVYLAKEPHDFPISKCPHHKRWIKGCPEFGDKVWGQIKDNDMICAGTIFGAVVPLRSFMAKFTDTLKRTKCNDQGILNVLTYTNQFDEPPVVWNYTERVVMNMNVAKEYNFEGSFVVHTGDNPKAVKAVKERDINLFKDVLTKEQSTKSVELLKTVDKLLKPSKVDYIIDGGTLIGATLHGGRIPWDDDLDIYIKEEDEEEFKRIISNNKSGLRVVPSYNGLYLKVVKLTPWPFIDVGLLTSNSTHMWEKRIKEKKYSHHVYRKEWLFPPKRTSYDGVNVNTANDPISFLSSRFGKNWHNNCVYANWDHTKEKIRHKYIGDGNAKVTIPCEHLKNWLQIKRISNN